MHDAERPHVPIALDYLLENDPGFFLSDLPAHFQQNAQVVPIAIVLHHVDIRSSFNRLVQTNRIRTAYHAVNLNLLVDAFEVIL